MELIPQAHDSLPVLARVPIRDLAATVYLGSLAPTGRRSTESRLRAVAQMLGLDDPLTIPWSALRWQHVERVRVLLAEQGVAPATTNATLAALRGVARSAWRLGAMPADEYQRIRAVRLERGSRLPRGRALSSGEIRALLDACAEDPRSSGVRDAALIALMTAGGLRRAEVVALDREHLDLERGELRVLGKGNRERIVYVDNGLADALADWVAIRGTAPGPLFQPIRKGRDGQIEGRRMTSQAVYLALARRAKAAGVNELSPHDLRRTFVSELLDLTGDLSVVAAMAGHADVRTTARYDRRGEQAKRRAARALHVPYTRRAGGGRHNS